MRVLNRIHMRMDTYVCAYECKYVHVACITPAVLSIFLTPLIYGIIGYMDLILSACLVNR